MVYTAVSKISAFSLRQIALAARISMQEPKDWDLDNLATTREGYSIDVFSRKAAIFSELGHIYKAYQRHFDLRENPSLPEVRRANIAVDMIDAQVRYVSGESLGGTLLSPGFGLVSHACESGREHVIKLLGLVARRLEGGDKMILSLYDVGVWRDHRKNRRSLVVA